MAVLKRKTSRSNTRHRRAQWKATTPTLVPVTIDGMLRDDCWRRWTGWPGGAVLGDFARLP
ncbi:50S ribosomal protein L32 [Streptomyces sp. NPDC050625]|uniref:50S ribosomal protein L32 n=1 Tax=Streptomyces sp. NPDC050625 TaxID=3154629 RepID=UPI003423665E